MASVYQRLAHATSQSAPADWARLFNGLESAEAGKGVWKEAEDKSNPALFVPKPAPNVDGHSLVEHGKTVWVLKRRATNTYVRLSPEDYFLWTLIDGERTTLKIALAFMKQYKSLALPRAISLVELLWQMRFLDNGSFDQVYLPLRQKLGQRSLQAGLGWVMQTFLSRQFAVKGFGDWVSWVYAHGVWVLYTWPVLLIFGLIGLSGLVLLVQQGDLQFRFPDDLSKLLIFFASTLVALFLHECGHAFTVKRFNRDVNRGGLIIMFGMPGAFVDTTDMWLAPKAGRLAVTAAGPLTNFVLAGAAALLQPVFPAAAADLHLFALFNYLLIITNLTPFIKLDGYYLLMDALEIANLRERALAFVSHGLGQTLKQAWAQGDWLPNLPREQKIFVLFGGISSLYTFYLIYFSTLFLPDRFLGVFRQLSGLNLSTLAGFGVLLTVMVTVVFGAAQLAFTAARLRKFVNQLEQAVRHLPLWQSLVVLITVAGVVSLIPNFLVSQHNLTTAQTWAIILSVSAPLLAAGIAAMLMRGMFASPWQGWYGALMLAGLGQASAAVLEAVGWAGPQAAWAIRISSAVLMLLALIRINRLWFPTWRGSIAGAWLLTGLGLCLALIPAPESVRLGSLLLLTGLFSAWHVTHIRLPVPVRPIDSTAVDESDLSREGVQLSRAFVWLMASTCQHAVTMLGKKSFEPLARSFNHEMANRKWALWFTAPDQFVDQTLGPAKERGRIYRTVIIVWLARFAAQSESKVASNALTEAYLELPPRLRRLAANHILSGFASDGSMPWEVDIRGGDRLRLRLAFHHLVAWPLKTCRQIYGPSLTHQVIQEFNQAAALSEWGFSIGGNDRITETEAGLQNVLALSENFQSALAHLLSRLAFYAGTEFVTSSLQQAYDTLAWQLREVAEPAFLRALPWARQFNVGRSLSVTEVLRQVPAFSGLSEAKLAELAKEARRERVPALKLIQKAGRRLDWARVICSGRVELVLRGDDTRRTTKALDAGTLIGFDEILQVSPAQWDVRTVMLVEFIRMPVGSVRQALETSSLSPEAILLGRIPLFRDLSTAQLRLLSEHLQPRDLLPNETVVRAGETGRELFIIGWGELQVSIPEATTERPIAQLGPGEFFGEMALLRDEPRSATVRALSDAQVFSLSAADYARFIQEMPSLQNALAQVGSRRQLELRAA